MTDGQSELARENTVYELRVPRLDRVTRGNISELRRLMDWYENHGYKTELIEEEEQ